MEFRRAAKVIALSAALHSPIFVGYAYNNCKPFRNAVSAIEEDTVKAKDGLSNLLYYREREALKRRARRGEVGLGEFVIRSNDIDERAKGRGFDVEAAVKDYKARLYWFNEYRKKGTAPKEAIYSVAYDLDYHGGMKGVLGRDLLQKSLNCETVALLGGTIAYDSGFEVDFRHYEKHLAAQIMIDHEPYDPQRGGKPVMKGAVFAASSLIDRYDSALGSFSYPPNEDGYPGWIPIFKKGAFSSPSELDHATGTVPGASLSRQDFDGDDSLPPIFYASPPDFDSLKIRTASFTFNGAAFDFTTQDIADKVYLDVAMTNLSSLIIFAGSSARFTSTSTPAEDAMWSGALVGMLQKMELYSAMIGRNQVSAAAKEQKMKALEEGRESLSRIKDPGTEFLNQNLEPKNPDMDPLLIAFLPPEGPKMLLEMASRYIGYLGESHPVATYFYSRYSLIKYLEIPQIKDQVLALINSLPIERKAEFIFDLKYYENSQMEGCEYEFCKVAGIVRRLNRVYGIEDATYNANSNSMGSSIEWAVSLDNYQFHLRGMMNDMAEGNRWVKSVFVAMKDDLRSVHMICSKPSSVCSKEASDSFNSFYDAMDKWEPD